MDDLVTALVHFCRGQGTQLKLWDIDFDTRCAQHLVHFLTSTTTTRNDHTAGSGRVPTVASLWIQNCSFHQEPNNEQGEQEGALSILCRFFASRQQTSSSCLLQTVSIKKCQLGNTGVNQLLQAFQDNRVVQTLDISYNNFNGRGPGLHNLLRHNTTLQHLIVAGNPLFSRHRRRPDEDNNGENDVSAMRALRRGLLCNRTLVSLNLSFCQLQNPDLHQLVVGDDDDDNDKSKNNHQHEKDGDKQETFALTELWLEHNQLQGMEAGTILQRLVQYTAPNLQVLSLDSNRQLGIDGARVLAMALKNSHNTSSCNTTTTTSKNDLKLRRLFVSCCGLQEQGTDCIVAAISQNTSLIQLHISGNSDSDTTTTLSATAQQQERKRLVQVYTKRNALWTRVVQPLLTPPSSSSTFVPAVAAEQRSPLWAQACVTCAQHDAHHGASAVYALVSEMVGLDFFHD